MDENFLDQVLPRVMGVFMLLPLVVLFFWKKKPNTNNLSSTPKDTVAEVQPSQPVQVKPKYERGKASSRFFRSIFGRTDKDILSPEDCFKTNFFIGLFLLIPIIIGFFKPFDLLGGQFRNLHISAAILLLAGWPLSKTSMSEQSKKFLLTIDGLIITGLAYFLLKYMFDAIQKFPELARKGEVKGFRYSPGISAFLASYGTWQIFYFGFKQDGESLPLHLRIIPIFAFFVGLILDFYIVYRFFSGFVGRIPN